MSSLISADAFKTATDEALRSRFGHVNAWVFDLDNTLYPPDSGLWPKIDERITLFLIELFGLDGQSARALHKHYYRQHGTTLRGLADENLDETEAFLEFVHDIDRSGLAPNPLLARELKRLPGRRLIFTNGSRKHAVLTARQLGLDGVFEDAFDIVDASLTPKPREAAYDAFFAKYDVDPRASAMFEDIAKNLSVPKARGMTTTLVTAKLGQADDREAHDQSLAEENEADFVTDDLAGFLARVNSVISSP